MQEIPLQLDEKTGVVKYFGDSVLLISDSLVSSIQKKFEVEDRLFLSRVMYLAGEETSLEAVSDAQKFFARTAGKLVRKGLIEEAMKLGNDRGFGIFKPGPFLNYDIGDGQIMVENSVIARTYGKSNSPTCFIIAGILAGAAQALYGNNFICKEKECMSTGKKYCLFELKPVSKQGRELFLKKMTWFEEGP